MLTTPGKATAVAGTGFIGPVHVEALRRLGRPIAGVLGSSLEKGQRAAQQLGLPRAYATFAELLADPDVGTVHIASPNRHHFEQSQAAIVAGKHVICEKPLAMNMRESAELMTLAKPQTAVTAVCYNIRFYPLCLEARQRIAAGELGELYHASGSYMQDWLLKQTDFNWRLLAEDGGALRAVADIGTHWLDLVQFITGLNVCEVCADLKTVWPTRLRPAGGVETFAGRPAGLADSPRGLQPVNVTTEDYGSVLLRFGGGARGCCTLSQVTAGRKNCLRFEIAGSKGSLAWNSERPNELWLGHRGRANEVLIRDLPQLHASVQRFSNYPGGHNEGFPDTFKQLFRAIYAAIDGDSTMSYPSFVDGHREIAICDAVLRSDCEHRWVNVEL